MTREATRFASDLAGVGGEQLREELVEVLENLRSATENVENVKGLIDSIPTDESVQGSIQKLAEVTRRHVERDQKVQDLRDRLHADELEFDRSRREFERVANQVLESESATKDQARIGREVLKAQNVLERFKTRIASKNIAEDVKRGNR